MFSALLTPASTDSSARRPRKARRKDYDDENQAERNHQQVIT
jgi:hypothetical protein